MMSVEAQTFTPKQLENQRLFRVGSSSMPEQPGDTAKRVVRKAAILAGATAADLAESWGAEKVLNKIKDKFVTKIQDETKKSRNNTYLSGALFVEDSASDQLYIVGMNSILRGMTGLPDVSYPSPTARFISGWTNLGSYASGKFSEPKRKFWKKPWNIVNAVNVEAGIGLLEELPGVGKAVTWLHKGVDGLLQKEAVQFANGMVAAAVTGYHIEKNMVSPARKVQAPVQEAQVAV